MTTSTSTIGSPEDRIKPLLESGCRTIDRVCPICSTPLIVSNGNPSDLIAGIAYCFHCDAHVIQNHQEAQHIIDETQKQGSVLVTPSMDENDALPTTPRSLTLAYHQRKQQQHTRVKEDSKESEQQQPSGKDESVVPGSNASVQEGIVVGAILPEVSKMEGAGQVHHEKDQPSPFVKKETVVASDPRLNPLDTKPSSSSSGILEQTLSHEAAVSQAIDRRDRISVECQSKADFALPPYETIREIAADVLTSKMVHGYSISTDLCGTCTMPLMQKRGHNTSECFVCLALRRKHAQVQQRNRPNNEPALEETSNDHKNADTPAVNVETGESGSESQLLQPSSSPMESTKPECLERPPDKLFNRVIVGDPVTTNDDAKETLSKPVVPGQDVDDICIQTPAQNSKNLSYSSLRLTISSDSIMPPTIDKLVELEKKAAKLLEEVKDASTHVDNLSLRQDSLTTKTLPSIDEHIPIATSQSSATSSKSKKAVTPKNNETIGREKSPGAENTSKSAQSGLTIDVPDTQIEVSEANHKSVKELPIDFDIKRDQVSKEIGQRLAKGWMLLNASCRQCSMPLLTDTFLKSECCVLCGILDTNKSIPKDPKPLQPLSPNAGKRSNDPSFSQQVLRKPLEPTAMDTPDSDISGVKTPLDAPSSDSESSCQLSNASRQPRQPGSIDPPESEDSLPSGRNPVSRTRSNSESTPYLNVAGGQSIDQSVAGDTSADETHIDLLVLGKDQLSVDNKSEIIDLSDFEDDKMDKTFSEAVPLMTTSSLSDSVVSLSRRIGSQNAVDPNARNMLSRAHLPGRLAEPKARYRSSSPGLSMARPPSLEVASHADNSCLPDRDGGSHHVSDRSSVYHSVHSMYMGHTRRRAPSPGLSSVALPNMGASISDVSSYKKSSSRDPKAKLPPQIITASASPRHRKPNNLSPYLSKRPQFFVRRRKQADDSSSYVASIMKKQPSPERVIDVEPLRKQFADGDPVEVDRSLFGNEDSRDDEAPELDALLSRIEKTKTQLSRTSSSDREREKRFAGLVRNLEQTTINLRAIEQS